MSFNYYLRNRYILLVIFVGALLSFSCRATRFVVDPDYKQPVSYNKVRIDMTSGLLGGGLKGYIYIIPDTQICFRLWGPLGYEIGKGFIYPSRILFYNQVDDILISDLKTQIENFSGCVLNLSVFQSLLLGNVDGFNNALNQLNSGLLNTQVSKRNGRSVVRISHKVNHSDMDVHFLYKRNQLKSIFLKLQKDKSFTEVSFDFVDVSNDRKICTFAF